LVIAAVPNTSLPAAVNITVISSADPLMIVDRTKKKVT
jgi:hypothetical protein